MKARDRGAPSYLEYSKHPQNTLKASMFRILLVQRQVQLQHVDARLAQKARGPAFGVLRDQLTDLVRGDAAGFRDARHLRFRRLRADVGIEAAGRCVSKSAGMGP